MTNVDHRSPREYLTLYLNKLFKIRNVDVNVNKNFFYILALVSHEFVHRRILEIFIHCDQSIKSNPSDVYRIKIALISCDFYNDN